MAKTLKQVEKNTQASFGYVKKDLLMLNDAMSDLQEKMQHLSLNHASLLGKIQKIENEVVKTEIKEKKLERKFKSSKKAKKKTAKKKTSSLKPLVYP